MDYDRFIYLVTRRLGMESESDGAQATRAVLQTVAERLPAGETADLASSLPREINRYMVEAGSEQAFSLREFVNRVRDRSNTGEEEAVLQSNVVLYTMSEAVTTQELRNARIQLPDSFDLMFQLVDRETNAPSHSE